MAAKYVSTREAAEITGLHPNTLRKYADAGKIKHYRLPNGDRRFDVSSWEHEPDSATVCYARVSRPKQKEDLQRQREYLLLKHPGAECLSDIGSGLNYKRKGFRSILERAIRGEKLRVVVTYRDRLVRFGFDLVEHIISMSGGEVVVLNKVDSSPESELVGDLTAIITIFSSRLHGLRSNKIKAYLAEADTRAEGEADDVDGGVQEGIQRNR